MSKAHVIEFNAHTLEPTGGQYHFSGDPAQVAEKVRSILFMSDRTAQVIDGVVWGKNLFFEVGSEVNQHAHEFASSPRSYSGPEGV